MTMLDARVGLDAAALFVTWAAIAFLVIIALNLHLRLQRLESVAAAGPRVNPYGRFVGSRLVDLLGGRAFELQPHLVVVLSQDCRACQRILTELAAPDWHTLTVLLWAGHAPADGPQLSAGTVVPPDSSALAARLGVTVTPFALWIDDEGTVVSASPINTLAAPTPSWTGRRVSPNLAQ
jgi:hypothetical protein